MIHIMMATYNGDKYIREQLDSIIAQTYSNWKLWISDDGSTDETLDVIKDYKILYPDKIEIILSDNKNKGSRGNFSYLYKSVPPGEYYAFCDQDDVWYKDKLNILVNKAKQVDKNVPVLVYHDMQVVDKEKNQIAPSFYNYAGIKLKSKRQLEQILMYNCIPGCTMLFNHALKDKIIDIPQNCIMHDWWILLSAICIEACIINTNEILSLYRQHGNNDIGAVKKNNLFHLLVKCLDFSHISKYKENNIKMKKERIVHANLLIQYYELQMNSMKKCIIEDFVHIIKSNHKVWRLLIATKNGFTFNDIIYTAKFYLLN